MFRVPCTSGTWCVYRRSAPPSRWYVSQVPTVRVAVPVVHATCTTVPRRRSSGTRLTYPWCAPSTQRYASGVPVVHAARTNGSRRRPDGTRHTHRRSAPTRRWCTVHVSALRASIRAGCRRVETGRQVMLKGLKPGVRSRTVCRPDSRHRNLAEVTAREGVIDQSARTLMRQSTRRRSLQ